MPRHEPTPKVAGKWGVGGRRWHCCIFCPLFILLLLCLTPGRPPALAAPVDINTANPAELTGLPLGATPRRHPGQTMVLADQEFFPVLVSHIRAAEERIDMAMFLFKITKSPRNKPALLLKELGQASRRGVQVEVLLEKSSYSDSINRENARVAEILRAQGITVRFDSKQRTTHNKMVIIDERFCFVGSHNITHAALAFNHELSLLIDSPHLAGQLRNYMATIK